MTYRKGRSVTFKLLRKVSIGLIRMTINNATSDAVVVFQDLGSEEFLVELESKVGSDTFDIEDLHVSCHPPMDPIQM